MNTMDNRIEECIAAGDYISAYLGIREDEALRREYTGRIVNAIVAELSGIPARGNRERLYYLRSVLMWIFRDIPGLAPLYRSQLREGMFADGSPDLLRFLAGAVTKGAPSSPEEAAEGVKQAVDGMVDDIKSGNADRRIRDFFDIAGEGIRSGVQGVSDFFDTLAAVSPENKPRTETEEDDKKDDN